MFDPKSSEPFKLSRSKVDNFIECPRCFYLDRRLGVGKPSIPAFTLNSAVDALLKKEFDVYRAEGTQHPIMENNNIDAVPFQHADLDKWRHNFTGVRYLHEPTNFLVFGAIDDVWVDPKGVLYIVDYKATSKKDEPTLDGRWQQAYKRQMEIYQWLMRGNGFKVSDTGYFVYVNGRRDSEDFGGKLEFDTYLIPYKGDGSWIEGTLKEIKDLLMQDKIPEASKLCEHCPYRDAAGKAIRDVYEKKDTQSRLF